MYINIINTPRKGNLNFYTTLVLKWNGNGSHMHIVLTLDSIHERIKNLAYLDFFQYKGFMNGSRLLMVTHISMHLT